MLWTRGELLGEGSYGRVYECMRDDGTLCAAKVVSLKKGIDSRSQLAQAEIEMEVEIMRKLNHPNIVRYLGTDRDETSLFIFLELIPCGSISNLLGKYGSFKEPVIRQYTRDVLQGLKYLHAQRILHRDVKGQNVLVDHHGSCKLSDFGCSKELLGEAASASTLKGTPRFMAPEVIRSRSKGYTQKADIW
jgi:mitogen-activated protein kinase kinase kinase ANP1